MTVAYVGNRKNLASDGKSFNTENHIALTLEKLGHTVNFIQEDEIYGSLVAKVNDCDMFLWTRTWKGKVNIDDLRMISHIMPTVSFHLDKYTGIQRNGGLADDPFWRTQYVFSPEGSAEAKRIFKSHGINQFYLPAGVFEDECYIADPVVEYMHDIIFVGSGNYSHPEWPYRNKLVEWLKNTYPYQFKKYGNPEQTVRGEELNKLYSSAKIVIGDSLCKDFTDEYYFSDRVFETTGRGGFIIHPHIIGLKQHFAILEAQAMRNKKIPYAELIVYPFDDFAYLKAAIDYFLEHDDEREAIRLAGHERTKRTNTYTQRMQQMLRVLKDEGAI